MTEKKSPVISFKDFSFQYRAQKKPTLTGINLDIYPGEKVLIAGPSGSGKSTLAGCVNGLNPDSGISLRKRKMKSLPLTRETRRDCRNE